VSFWLHAGMGGSVQRVVRPPRVTNLEKWQQLEYGHDNRYQLQEKSIT